MDNETGNRSILEPGKGSVPAEAFPVFRAGLVKSLVREPIL